MLSFGPWRTTRKCKMAFCFFSLFFCLLLPSSPPSHKSWHTKSLSPVIFGAFCLNFNPPNEVQIHCFFLPVCFPFLPFYLEIDFSFLLAKTTLATFSFVFFPSPLFFCMFFTKLHFEKSVPFSLPPFTYRNVFVNPLLLRLRFLWNFFLGNIQRHEVGKRWGNCLN